MMTTRMKNAGAFVLALATASSMTVFAHPAATPVADSARQEPAKRTSTSKGIIKSLNDTTIVILPADNRNMEVTFKLTSATTRSGELSTGEVVTVTYYFEQGQRVATLLAGKATAKANSK